MIETGARASAPRPRSELRGILLGGFTVGVLDILYAFTLAAQRGRPPSRVLLTIASGLLGSRAFEGGVAVMALGLFCHFVIALGAALVYFLAARRLPVLRGRALVTGPVYGVLVYLFMNFVVLPISAFPLHVTYPPRVLAQGFISHMLLVGIPIAFLASRYWGSRPEVPRIAAAILAIGLTLTPAAPALGQGTGATWVSLDGQPQGTPARVLLNPDLSDPSQTAIDVYLSGFYVTQRVGADGLTYQDLSVPGLPNSSAPGKPRLPLVRADVGVVTDAAAASLTSALIFDLRTFPGYLVWPSPIPAQIHDGTPSQFVKDSTTYASTADVPAVNGAGGVKRATLGGIPASICTAYPIHWNPASGALSVAVHSRFVFGHGGGLSTPMGITREHDRLADDALVNWDVISPDFVIDQFHFNGAFLFVCPNAWMPYLQPLIQEKKTRGFAVSVVNVPLSGESCSQLQQSIQTWYASTPAGFDHYCILVGSAGSTPYCFQHYQAYNQLTDKVLSSVDGDLEPEIYLGRLFVASTAELQTQVKKILDYETGPPVNNDQNVLLVAHHQQDQDFDFPSYQEEVRNALYAQVSPNFTTLYGTNSSVGNADLTNDIAAGVGVVAYMGHGMTGSWHRWTALEDSFTYTHAAALTNGPMTPVVWSIACQTGDPRQAQSLASGFMKNSQGGSVAFYGAVDQTFGSIVTVLNDSLFQAVYGRGITRNGLAIARGEHAMAVADSQFGYDAAVKYILYGDPEMAIKRHNPSVYAPIDLLVPITILTPCPGVDCCPSCPAPVVDIQARDSVGAPIPGVKVGIWKPTMAGTDQVLDNRYSGPDGWVHIPAPGLTAGILHVGFDDGDGRAGMDSIDVQATITGVETGLSPPLHFTAAPSVTSGSTRLGFGRPLDVPARVSLFSVDGRLVRVLNAPRGVAFLRWDGRDQSGRPAAAGLYLARLDAGKYRAGRESWS